MNTIPARRSGTTLWAAVVALSLSACASQVTQTEQASAAREPVRALARYEVTMSPHSKAQLADNLKFDLGALQTMIGRSLEAKNLIAADGDFDLQVVVDDIRVRGSVTAVLFGFMAGDDHLNGTATLVRGDGRKVGSFGVSASYALGGIAGGQDSVRLGWLYEEFARLLALELVARRDARP